MWPASHIVPVSTLLRGDLSSSNNSRRRIYSGAALLCSHTRCHLVTTASHQRQRQTDRWQTDGSTLRLSRGSIDTRRKMLCESRAPAGLHLPSRATSRGRGCPACHQIKLGRPHAALRALVVLQQPPRPYAKLRMTTATNPVNATEDICGPLFPFPQERVLSFCCQPHQNQSFHLNQISGRSVVSTIKTKAKG